MKEKLTNQNSVLKTICFNLLPVAETEDNFNSKQLLEQDEQRALNYQKVKGYMDKYHKFFIESVLSQMKLDVSDYAQLYFKANRSEAEEASLENMESVFRKLISKQFKKDSRYTKLSKKEFIREILPEYLTDKEELEIVSQFFDFSTYFTGFFQNRENMYTDEAQSTGIAYRCINDNLPKFLDNVLSFDVIAARLPKENIESLERDFSGLWNVRATDIFTVDYYSFILAQSGIDKYNRIIGGGLTKDGEKIQGLNEYINLYNQQIAGRDRSFRLPLLKPLFKQILSDRSTESFIPETFSGDKEVLEAINKFYLSKIKDSISGITNLFSRLNEFDSDGIYITNGAAVTDISNKVFGSWNVISDKWNADYEIAHPKKKTVNEEKYAEARKKAFKAIKSFSVSEIQKYGDDSVNDYYSTTVRELCGAVGERYSEAEKLLCCEYTGKKLSTDKEATEKIKNLLDAIKDVEWILKPLLGSGKEG